jgi:hypothetical protein
LTDASGAQGLPDLRLDVPTIDAGVGLDLRLVS